MQTDQEGESEDDGSVCAVGVVCRIREDKVKIRHQSTGICDERGPHREDWTDKTFIDQSINTAIFDKSLRAMLARCILLRNSTYPCVFC